MLGGWRLWLLPECSAQRVGVYPVIIIGDISVAHTAMAIAKSHSLLLCDPLNKEYHTDHKRNDTGNPEYRVNASEKTQC